MLSIVSNDLSLHVLYAMARQLDDIYFHVLNDKYKHLFSPCPMKTHRESRWQHLSLTHM